MAQAVSIRLNTTDRRRLEQIAGDRNHLHKHVQRARIVLLVHAAPVSVARRSGAAAALG